MSKEIENKQTNKQTNKTKTKQKLLCTEKKTSTLKLQVPNPSSRHLKQLPAGISPVKITKAYSKALLTSHPKYCRTRTQVEIAQFFRQQ
jgi:hypothetical protein